MSKIALSGDASGTGTFTIASPNSNSNFTLTLPTESGTVLTGNTTTGFKNRLINGEMDIDQRNAGASVSISGLVNQYTLDRWNIRNDAEAVVSVQQSSTAPTGFNNSLIYTVTTADTSLGATQRYLIQQRVEGFNCADFGWGTANAQTVTLSFWVRSSLTGTFGGALGNSGGTRSYPFTYSISAANTWEYKTITIAGDTTGTWLTTSGIGIVVTWSMGSGSSNSGTAGAWAGAELTSATGATSVVGTNGATFYITGVQFEKGTQATSFDFRSITQELALCQRYYLKLGPGSNFFSFDNYNTTSASCNIHFPFPVAMRATPTGSISAIGDFGFSNTSSGNFAATGLTSTTGRLGTDATGTGRCQWYTNNANAFAAYSIEL